MFKDHLLPYKGQLEAMTGESWPWYRVAEESGLSDETLRTMRRDPTKVNLATLLSWEAFLRSRGIPFRASELIPAPPPLPV